MNVNEIKLKINMNMSLINYVHGLLRYIHQGTISGSSTNKNQILSGFDYGACFELGHTITKNKISIRLSNFKVFFAGTLQHPNSLTLNDVCVTILPFKRIISLLVTILICRKEEIYSHVIHMYYTLSSITFPQNACIHSVLVISIFIFEQKILLYL